MRAGNRTPGARRFARRGPRHLARPEELLVALPKTTADEARVARVVEEGLCEAVPEATSGSATYREGDTGEDLLQHVRAATR